SLVFRYVLLIWIVSPVPAAAAQNPKDEEADFDREAFAALPAEASYTFHRELTEGVDPELSRGDPSARPEPDEMAVKNEGWRLVIPSSAGHTGFIKAVANGVKRARKIRSLAQAKPFF